MSDHDLTSDDSLRAVCDLMSRDPRLQRRGHDLAETIRRVRAAGGSEGGTREFQQWDDKSVSAVGQGTIPMDRALEDAGSGNGSLRSR